MPNSSLSINGSRNDMVAGYEYTENIKALNSGGMDEWVRAVINWYWTDSDGTHNVELDNRKINFVLNDTDWILDEDGSTSERKVLYYRHLLPVGEYTANVITGVSIDPSVNTDYQITKEGDQYTNISMVKTYAGKKVFLSVEFDGVQRNNGETAIKSAWGRDVTIVGDELFLD